MAMAFPLRTIARVDSDGELIQRAAAGEHSAFEDLYRRYARAVFGLALRRLIALCRQAGLRSAFGPLASAA